MGLVDGARKAKDGIVFFGKDLKNNENVVINDFALNIQNNEELNKSSEINILHLFLIYYKRENKKYYLKTYKDKTKFNQNLPFVLIRIDQPCAIKRKILIKVGEYFFQMIPKNEDNSLEIIQINPKNNDKIKFSYDINNSPITIGRNKSCSIQFPEDKSFSRIHCSVFYNSEQNQWLCKDGTDKPSTNGSWLYAQSSYEIHNGMNFKIINSVFQIDFSN